MTGLHEGDTRIASRGAFCDIVRATVREAAADGCRELWCCDVDFADWPLGEPGVVDDLARWAGRPGSLCRLHLLAVDFGPVLRLHPRFVEWRRRWAHLVTCRQDTRLGAAGMPTLLLAPGLASLRLFGGAGFHGVHSRHGPEAAHVKGWLDAVSQQSVDAFAATVTGL